jgi:voltage-gated potassium channel
VTICTVGYGDYYPVTTLGRITGTFVMLAGVGIIGALASILASVLVSPKTEAPQPTDDVGELRRQLDRTQAELAALRESVAAGGKST